jgi:hypothetical protein
VTHRTLATKHVAALVAVVVLVLAVVAGLAWRAWGDGTSDSLPEPIAVNGTIDPPQHLFGDPIRARIEVVLDERRVDPASVKLLADFAPYRPIEPRVVERSTSGAITRIRYDYRLSCLVYRCLPRGQRRFELKNATVEYRRRDGAPPQIEEIDWPPLTMTGRVPQGRFWEAQMRAEFRDPGRPTYGVPPRAVSVVGLVLAVLFGAAAVILALRLLPLTRLAEFLGLRTVDRRTRLERALARVHETTERPDEGRRALELLAYELRRSPRPELAGAASELAWSREFPGDGRLTSLSGEVEALIRRQHETP